MDFSQKYHLIELLPGEGVQSYRARQSNTGRDVTVHLLAGGTTPENEAFLVRLRAMQPPSMAKLMEVGNHQGATFVVTMAPPYQRLDEWLAEQDRAAAAAKEFGKAGIWKSPDAGSLTRPQPVKAPEPPSPLPQAGSPAPRAPEPGEFTKQFQRPAAPAAEPGLPAASPFTAQFPAAGSAPPIPPARPAATPSTEPGEFTRMFQSPVAAPAPEPVAPPACAATTQFTPPMPAARPAATPSTEPGEFTRMFQAPPSPQAGPPPAPEPVAPSP